MGVNGNPGSGVTAVIAGAPGAYTSCGRRSTGCKQKPRAGRGFREADRVKSDFELSAHNSSQTNQPSSEQSESARLGNGDDDGVAATQRHLSHKTVPASVNRNLYCGAIHGRPVVPGAADRTLHGVADGTAGTANERRPSHITDERAVKDHAVGKAI